MEENVREELEKVKGMVLAWKASYLLGSPPEGGDEFLAQDFLDEIENQVYPYIRRMYESTSLTQSEVEGFMQFCYDQVEDLRGPSEVAEVEEDDTIWPPGNEKEAFGPH